MKKGEVIDYYKNLENIKAATNDKLESMDYEPFKIEGNYLFSRKKRDHAMKSDH